MFCHICNQDIDVNAVAFSNNHLKKVHSILPKVYYDTYIKTGLDGICDACGSQTVYISLTQGYRKYCSTNCSNSSDEVKRKKSTTCQFNYGVSSPLQSPIIKERIKQTNNNKYGTDYALQSASVINKRLKTNLDKYGVDNVFAASEIKDKIKSTNLDRYGVENPSQNKLIYNKIHNTMIARYGVEHALHNTAIHDKSKSTLKLNYDVDNPMKSPIIQERAKRTNMMRYGVSCTLCDPTVKEKGKLSCILNYGAEHPSKSGIIQSQRKMTCRSLYWDVYIQKMQLKHLEPLFNKDMYVIGNSFNIKCTLCNNTFTTDQTNPQKITCGCLKIRSKEEDQIIQWLNDICPDIDIKPNQRFVHNSTSYELDIYLPIYNIGIEFCGLYWHSDINKPRSYHQNKYKFFKSMGIDTVQIFENEWLHKTDIVKSIILSRLKHNRSIYARHCEIHEIDTNQYKTFVNDNHLQGYVNSSIKIGLFLNNELVSIMSFNRSRYNNSYSYELIRYCCKLNTTIIGGFSKQLKYFETLYQPKSLVSYCDLRYFSGSGYEHNGFTTTGITSPNYFYFKQNTTILHSRLRYQKHLLTKKLDKFDANKSEYENMILNKYLRIYDSGNLRLVKIYNKV